MEKEVEHNMSTLFLQLTQVLMSQIVAARNISTLNELKKKRWCSCDMSTSTPQFIRFYKGTWILVTNTAFIVKRAFISLAPPRECVYLNIGEFFFLPYSSNTRMEGVWCNNALTPGVDISLFGKHCSRMLFCQPPINNESKRRLM